MIITTTFPYLNEFPMCADNHPAQQENKALDMLMQFVDTRDTVFKGCKLMGTPSCSGACKHFQIKANNTMITSDILLLGKTPTDTIQQGPQ